MRKRVWSKKARKQEKEKVDDVWGVEVKVHGKIEYRWGWCIRNMWRDKNTCKKWKCE